MKSSYPFTLCLCRLVALAVSLPAGFLSLLAAGEDCVDGLSDTLTVHFRQSSVTIDSLYMDNGVAMSKFRNSLCAPADSGQRLVLRKVDVSGAASPEGTVVFNDWLSERRAETLRRWAGNYVALPDSLVSMTFIGRDWKGLQRMVLADPEVPYRDEVLALLGRITARRGDVGNADARSIAMLKALRGGVPYAYMYRRLFPSLRKSTLTLHYAAAGTCAAVRHDGSDILATVADTVTVAEEYIAETETVVAMPLREHRPLYMDVGTNMLLDVLAVPNAAVELYVGRGVSVRAGWMYAWWDSDRRHRYWRLYGGDVGVRWWFGGAARRKPLTGHHVGVYGGLLIYDFEWGGRGYMGGRPGCTLWDKGNVHAGVEYGYSLPVGRRLNIDFTVGVGYMGGEQWQYLPSDDGYVWQSTQRRRWLGPTKAEISLVWLLGRSNRNDGR